MRTERAAAIDAGTPDVARGDADPHYLRNLLSALQLARAGDFTVRLSSDQVGLQGKIADAFNDIIACNQRMAQQLEQVGQTVGREGKTRPACGLASPQARGAGWSCRSTG